MSEVSPTLQLEKVITATPSQVFEAWTQPAYIARWWGISAQHETFLSEIDLRQGGRYRLGMRSPDGQEYIVGGEYQEILLNQKLVFTWLWEHSAENYPISLVTVQFQVHDLGCLVQLKHERLPAEQAESHTQGWQSILNRIATLWP